MSDDRTRQVEYRSIRGLVKFSVYVTHLTDEQATELASRLTHIRDVRSACRSHVAPGKPDTFEVTMKAAYVDKTLVAWLQAGTVVFDYQSEICEKG